MSSLPREVRVFRGSSYYAKFLRSFSPNSNGKPLSLRDGKISQAIFFHLYKVFHAEWDMKVAFDRRVNHAHSDFFQDLVAFYLKQILGSGFTTRLEERQKGIQPDILIQYNGKNVFIIEIKTTMGWERRNLRGRLSKRIRRLSRTFRVPKRNVVFLLKSPKNVDRFFKGLYWDGRIAKAKKHPTEFPYSNVYPLFYEGPDPFYWKYKKGFNKQERVKNWQAQTVLRRAKKDVICPIETIIRKIQQVEKRPRACLA